MVAACIVLHNVGPLAAAMVAVGAPHAGKANNVIPALAVLVKTPAETAFAREAALERVGAERGTLQGAPLTASEDSQRRRHHPGFDFDDRNIGVGSAQSVHLAARFLAANGQAAARLTPHSGGLAI